MPSASQNRSVSSQRSAFTLIELLVVIAIIAILAAILFPVFAQARDKARSATSLSNVKQQILAQLMYVQDYDETFVPMVTDANVESDYEVSWMFKLQPYVKNEKLFYSPNARNQTPVDLTRASGKSGGIIFSYGMLARWKYYSGEDPSPTSLWQTPFGNALQDGVGGYYTVDGTDGGHLIWGAAPGTYCGTNALQGARVVPSASLAQVARPAETAVVFDSLTMDGGAAAENVVPAYCDSMSDPPYVGPGYRFAFAPRYAYEGLKSQAAFPTLTYQAGSGAVGFADGHAKMMRTETFYSTFKTTGGQDAYKYQYIGE